MLIGIKVATALLLSCHWLLADFRPRFSNVTAKSSVSDVLIISYDLETTGSSTKISVLLYKNDNNTVSPTEFSLSRDFNVVNAGSSKRLTIRLHSRIKVSKIKLTAQKQG